MSSPTDIVIIPGAWHTSASYRKFTIALSTAFPSIRVTVLPLPSITNDPSPTADLYTDTAFVRSSVSQMISEGRRLAILMHSYGGLVGSNALHGLYHQETTGGAGGGITHLIYVAAAMFFPNSLMPFPNSLMAVAYGDSKPNVSVVDPSHFDFLPDGRVVVLHPVEIWIGTEEGDKGEATEEEIAEYVSTITPIATKVASQKTEHAAWMDGKKFQEEGGPQVVYVMTTKDIPVPFELQEWMVKRAREEVGVDVKTVRMETGHVPTLTSTAELVRILGDVLGE